MRLTPLAAIAVVLATLLGAAGYVAREGSAPMSESGAVEQVDGSIEPLCTDRGASIRTLADLRASGLHIEIPKSRKWAANIVAAKTSTGRAIGDEFKKKFKARIYVATDGGAPCVFKASVRISGDWRDHLAIQNGAPIASLDVQMEEGNLAGMVDFKLLLPRTRGGDNEVMMAALMRRMNLLAPRTGYLDVSVNGTPVRYLFQENPEKELVESQARREAPLFESDESMFWQDRIDAADATSINQRIITPKTTNADWIGGSDNRAAIAKRGNDILMSAYSSYWQDHYVYPELIANGNAELLRRNNEFVALMLAANAKHGLIVHNRRFFMDPMRNGLEPIYYDGDAELLDAGREALAPTYGAHVGAQSLLPRLGVLDTATLIEQARDLGVTANDAEIDALLTGLRQRLGAYAEAAVPAPKRPAWKAANFTGLNGQDRAIVFAHNRDRASVCSFDMASCQDRTYTVDQFAALLGGKLTIDGVRHIYVGSDPARYAAGQSPAQDAMTPAELYSLNTNTTMLVSGPAQVTVDKARRAVTVTATAPGSRVNIQDGDLTGWSLTYASAPGLEATDAVDRFDDRLLTGCVTVSDTVVDRARFTITGSLCEDAINFVRATGDIASMAIDGTLEDGLDMDFSTLVIDELSVANTGNDCLDLSQGDYRVRTMMLVACGDKGASVGEVSTVAIDGGVIDGVGSIGIAVKDWSTLTASSLEMRGAAVCLSLYRKKQEFGAPQAAVTDLHCDPNVTTVQRNARLEDAA